MNDDRFLHLTRDRKVSPMGWYQESRDRWIPTVPNSFGLPAGVSCPGKTEFCRSCYAVRSERSAGVHDAVMHNYRLLTEAGSLDAMTMLLAEMVGRFLRSAARKGVDDRDLMFRIHWDGDFFSMDYAEAWARVIRGTPSVRFWVYTRSFVPPVNVVPVLAGIPNLALYLSADEWNAVAARGIISEYSGVHLAVCADDYEDARALTDRPSIVCPENAERMPLMSKHGRGACVDCRLCPDGRKDVLFSTSHSESVAIAAPHLRVSHRPRELKPVVTHCQNPACGKEIVQRTGPGRRRLYCDAACRHAARSDREVLPSTTAPIHAIVVETRSCRGCGVDIEVRLGPGRRREWCEQCRSLGRHRHRREPERVVA